MITRPFALVGFSFVFALLMLGIADGSAAVVAAAAGCCLLLSFAFHRFFAWKTLAVSMASVLVACLLYEGTEQLVRKPALSLCGEDRRIEAVVLPDTGSTNKNRYQTIKATGVDGEPCSCKLYLYSDEPLEAQPYDTLSFVGKIGALGSGVPSLTQKADKIFLTAYTEGRVSVKTGNRHSLGYVIYSLRHGIQSCVRNLIKGNEGGLAAAMITGDKSGLSNKVRNDFASCGLSHTLAVSGLHMSIVVLSLYELLMRRFRHRRPFVAAVCIALAGLYAGISGFSLSAVRSAVMVSSMLFGKIISRSSDPINAMGAAAFGITLVNPYAVFDLGFMLSFSATLGIVLFVRTFSQPLINRCSAVSNGFVRRLLTVFSQVVCTTIIATAFCLPVHIMFFGTTSPVFVPANLLVFFTVPVIVFTGLAAALLNVLPIISFAASVPAFVCGLFAKYALTVIDRLARQKFAVVDIDNFAMKLWLGLVFVSVGVALLLTTNKTKAFRACARLACAALSLIAAVGIVRNYGYVTVSSLLPGTDSCFVVSQGVNSVVIGCGGDSSSSISASLNRLGVENIRLLILPQLTEEYSGCADELLREKDVERLILPEKASFAIGAGSFEITDSYTCDFYGVKIIYRCEGAQCYCRLESKSGSVLFTFSPKTDREFVGENAKADYLFSRGQPPEWLDTEGYNAVVLPKSGWADSNENVYTTQQGAVTLRFKKGGKYDVKLLGR